MAEETSFGIDETPFAIDNILFETAICLAKIKNMVVGLRNLEQKNPYLQERPKYGLQQLKNRYLYNVKDYKAFFIKQKGSFPERNEKYSDYFYTRMETAPPFAVDFFLDLQRDFIDLSIEELKLLKESVEQVPEIIKSFMPQDEILKKMCSEDSINHREAHDRFLTNLGNDTSSSINYHYQMLQNEKLHVIASKMLLDRWNFQFPMTSANSKYGDYPITTGIQNIPDIMLNYYNCYSGLINRLIERDRIKSEKKLEENEEKMRGGRYKLKRKLKTKKRKLRITKKQKITFKRKQKWNKK